ncbi:MAG: hypothetical protein ACOCS7_02125 [Halolamina sp.]
MPLRDIAYLEIDYEDSSGTVHTGVFELHEDLEQNTEVDIKYLLANRGQYLNEAWSISNDVLPEDVTDEDLERRKGYHVDGGAGIWTRTITATGTQGDTWGDGSTGADDPSDVSKYDATGCDPQAMKDVLEWFLSQPRHGSTGNARLYIGEWSDGTYADSAGAFEKPWRCAITNGTVSRDPDDPSAVSVSLELAWTATYPGAVGDTIDNIGDWLEDL